MAYSLDSEKCCALEKEVSALLEKEATEKVLPPFSPGFYNRLFVVPKASGGWRPVLDVSALNLFVKKTKFVMETTQSMLSSLLPGDWMVSIDLQDAYFHIPIHPASRKFLRFVFKGEVFQFRAMCFGLSTAPQVFTRVLSSVAKWLHLLGIRTVFYLDDWLLRAKTKERCVKDLEKTLHLTEELGLLVNWQKSHLVPSQELVYLGVQMNSVVFQASLSVERVESCLLKVRDFLKKTQCSANEWMSLLGKLSSAEPFVSLGRLHLRPLQFFLREVWDRKKSPDSFVFQISEEIKADLSWWNSPEKLQEGISLFPKNPNLILCADASDLGWGATLGKLETAGRWKGEQLRWHISLKELKAIHLALLEFSKVVRNQAVIVQSDNTTALAYIKKQGGTHSFSLYLVARDLLLWAKTNQTTLMTRFIPGKLNVRADELSRSFQVLSTEWILNQEVCLQLWNLWGRPLIDLFATKKTTQLPLYCSPVPDEGAVFVDAKLMDW